MKALVSLFLVVQAYFGVYFPEMAKYFTSESLSPPPNDPILPNLYGRDSSILI